MITRQEVAWRRRTQGDGSCVVLCAVLFQILALSLGCNQSEFREEPALFVQAHVEREAATRFYWFSSGRLVLLKEDFDLPSGEVGAWLAHPAWDYLFTKEVWAEFCEKANRVEAASLPDASEPDGAVWLWAGENRASGEDRSWIRAVLMKSDGSIVTICSLPNCAENLDELIRFINASIPMKCRIDWRPADGPSGCAAGPLHELKD